MAEVGDNFFYVKIFSPFEVFYEGEITALSAINETGEFDVLRDHANFITILPAGKVKILTRYGKREVEINRGILRVSNNKAVLFSNV